MLDILKKRETTLKTASDAARWLYMWRLLGAHATGEEYPIERQFASIDERESIDARLRLYSSIHGRFWEDDREGVVENFRAELNKIYSDKEKGDHQISQAQADELAMMIPILENESTLAEVESLFKSSRTLEAM